MTLLMSGLRGSDRYNNENGLQPRIFPKVPWDDMGLVKVPREECRAGSALGIKVSGPG